MASLRSEINTSKEDEFPSKSTRISLANLSKLGVFSTSKCTTPIEAAQVVQDSEKQTSKPPSLQRRTKKDESQTVSTQRLDTRIDLPSSKSANIAARDNVTRDQGNAEEKPHVDSKIKTLPNISPMWERNKDTKERKRTKTWPALHYKLWLDASNLSFDLLAKDERTNRPPEYARPHTRDRRRTEANLVHNGDESSSKGVRKSKDLSTLFLSVSRPPSSANSTRMRKESGVVMEGAVDLQVGVGESWQVTSSYAHKRRQNNSACVHMYTSTGGSNMALAIQQSRKKPYPRLPSRMGSNNLETFLKQNIIPRTNDAERHGLSSELTALVSPRYFCNTSAELSLMNLRSYARNPRMLQELTKKEKERLRPSATICKNDYMPNELGRAATDASQRLVAGVKEVRFRVPCGSSEEDKRGIVRTKKSSSLKQTWSDVTPPPTPPTFEQTYEIQHLHTKGVRTGSRGQQSLA